MLSKGPTSRIPALDGWRGIAILFVLFAHWVLRLHPDGPLWIFRIGQLGVAIFFVLSGFLITTLLCEEYSRSGDINLRRFYIRRFFRLMPCAWLYLVAIAVFGVINHRTVYIPRETPSALFFFRNYVSGGGFTEHFWSLSIEEQFYLFWPGVLFLLGKRRAGWFAAASAAVVALWRLRHWSWLTSQPFTNTAPTQYRVDAIFIGCLLALSLPHLRPYLRNWMTLPLVLGIAACTRYESLVSTHLCILIALLLAITSQSAALPLLNWKPLAWLGTISYSVYVWQQPFWITAVPTKRSLAVALVGVTFVATLSYYFIEAPLIRFGRRLTQSPDTLKTAESETPVSSYPEPA